MRVVALTSLALALAAFSLPLSVRNEGGVSVLGNNEGGLLKHGSIDATQKPDLMSTGNDVKDTASQLGEQVKSTVEGANPSTSDPNTGTPLRARVDGGVSGAGGIIGSVTKETGSLAGGADGAGGIGNAVGGATGKANGSTGNPNGASGVVRRDGTTPTPVNVNGETLDGVSIDQIKNVADAVGSKLGTKAGSPDPASIV